MSYKSTIGIYLMYIIESIKFSFMAIFTVLIIAF